MTPEARQADRDFLATLSVVYVEDDPVTRDLMEAVLRRRVGKVEVARNGREGIDAAQRLHPDLMLTDLQMPVMDGLAMVKELAALGLALPVLVTTAFEQPDYLVRCIELGIKAYIVKPIDPRRLEDALLDCAHQLLTEARLARQARLEAESQRHRVVALLAAGMAHDYNNLLHVVLTNVSEALAEVPAGSELHDMLRDAEGGALEATRLGAQLQLLARTGKFKFEHLAIEPLLRETIDPLLSGSGVNLVLLVPPSAAVRADPRSLGSLFGQLATNALEAMPLGGTLTITASEASSAFVEASMLPPGPYLHLEVSDTGEGISAADLPRIFDPYFSTKERAGTRGMGLGLSLARELAEMHGGRLTAASSPGSGSTFHLCLPVS